MLTNGAYVTQHYRSGKFFMNRWQTIHEKLKKNYIHELVRDMNSHSKFDLWSIPSTNINENTKNEIPRALRSPKAAAKSPLLY